MKWNRILWVIVAAAIAWVALLFLQIKSIQHSRNIVEEQFEQKVKMALCSAVDAAKSQQKPEPQPEPQPQPASCMLLVKEVQCSSPLADSLYQTGVLETALEEAFDFYGIPGPYELSIIENNLIQKNSPYCCSLSPLIETDAHLLHIFFPAKKEYVRSQLSFIFFSSVAILLFITTIFILGCYTLLRQKHLHQVNIDFFNNMAHELRTPLTNIGLATNLLRKKQPDLGENNYLGIVDRENQRMRQQVERVLHLASLDEGCYQLEKEQVLIGPLLQGIIEDMRIQIQEKSAEVKIIQKEKDIAILADRFHLSNAFRNLLDNALKYAVEKPVIEISVKATAQGVYILFADNGIGISKKDQRTIFDKFQRMDKARHKSEKGFGLGLTYVKMIVEGHQGFIQVFSEINQGSRFNLFLPAIWS